MLQNQNIIELNTCNSSVSQALEIALLSFSFQALHGDVTFEFEGSDHIGVVEFFQDGMFVE